MQSEHNSEYTVLFVQALTTFHRKMTMFLCLFFKIFSINFLILGKQMRKQHFEAKILLDVGRQLKKDLAIKKATALCN